MKDMMKRLFVATALSLLAMPASSHALTATSETAIFYRDAGQALPVLRVPGYVDRAVMASNATSTTLTVPGWASDSYPNRSGMAVFNSSNGAAIWGVCAASATANRCTSVTPPWNPASGSVTNGTDYDPMPTAYWLEPVGGSRVTSLTFITDTSGTAVWVRYYRAK